MQGAVTVMQALQQHPCHHKVRTADMGSRLLGALSCEADSLHCGRCLAHAARRAGRAAVAGE